MKSPQTMTLTAKLTTPHFWLLTISATLTAIHLNLIWQTQDPNLTATSLLIFGAALSLLQERPHLKLESGILPSAIGALIIFAILVKALFVTGGAYFPRLSPIISALGLALLASGFTGIKQYWKELAIISLIGIPQILLPLLFDPSYLTARFAALSLWYVGFGVVNDGINVRLPTGAIEVYQGCSGIESMAQLLSFAALFLLMFPTRWSQKVFVPLLAVAIGFVFNGFRVALLGVLVAGDRQQAFDYWHDGGGSLIFSAIAVGLFGAICVSVLRRNRLEEAS